MKSRSKQRLFYGKTIIVCRLTNTPAHARKGYEYLFEICLIQLVCAVGRSFCRCVLWCEITTLIISLYIALHGAEASEEYSSFLFVRKKKKKTVHAFELKSGRTEEIAREPLWNAIFLFNIFDSRASFLRNFMRLMLCVVGFFGHQM